MAEESQTTGADQAETETSEALGNTVAFDTFTLDAPNPQMNGAGMLYALSGFVLKGTADGRILSGNALRYNHSQGEIYANGNVLMLLPLSPVSSKGTNTPLIRLQAKELGMRRLNPGDKDYTERKGRFNYLGTAKDITLWLPFQGRVVRMRAKSIELKPHCLVLEHVTVDGGYGSVLNFHSSKLVIGLFNEPREDREGFAREVEDLTVWQPQVGFTDDPLGVPFFWLPVVYRDFRLDYPWTRYRFGRSQDLGYYVHGQIGSNLPPIQLGYKTVDGERIPLHLRTRLEGRYHYGAKTGQGYGGLFRWEHDYLGIGKAYAFTMPHERIFPDSSTSYRNKEGDRAYTTRSATAVDVEHQFNQGSLSMYGRYVRIPDADPLEPGETATADNQQPTERFRNDHLYEYLESDPAPRRGIALAYSSDWFSAVIDHEGKVHPDLDESERDIGVQLTAPPVKLLGPLHLNISGWAEQIVHDGPEQRYDGGTWRDAEVQRFTYKPSLSMSKWIGGYGFDWEAGIQGAYERNGSREDYRNNAGISVQTSTNSVSQQSRVQAFGSAGVRLRLEREWGNDEIRYEHILTPRLGIAFTGAEHGDSGSEWTDLGFDDDRASLEDERQFITLGFNTSLTKNSRSLLSADVVSSWSWREEDQTSIRKFDDGTTETFTTNSPLIEIDGRLTFNPLATFKTTSTFTYNFVEKAWTDLSASIDYMPSRHVELSWSSVLIPDSDREGIEEIEDWEHNARATFSGNRYTVGGGVTMRPLGRDIDVYSLSVARRFTDGVITVVGEYSWDEQGREADQSISLSISLFGLGAFGLGANQFGAGQ